MRLSRTMSLVEAGANLLVGFWLAVLTQKVAFQMLALMATVSDHLTIDLIFEVVSLTTGYCCGAI